MQEKDLAAFNSVAVEKVDKRKISGCMGVRRGNAGTPEWTKRKFWLQRGQKGPRYGTAPEAPLRLYLAALEWLLRGARRGSGPGARYGTAPEAPLRLYLAAPAARDLKHFVVYFF